MSDFSNFLTNAPPGQPSFTDWLAQPQQMTGLGRIPAMVGTNFVGGAANSLDTVVSIISQGMPDWASMDAAAGITPPPAINWSQEARDAGLADRPDLMPQNRVERYIAAASRGAGSAAPFIPFGGASSAIPALSSGAGAGTGAQAGADIFPSSKIAPVIGALAGGALGAGIAGRALASREVLPTAQDLKDQASDAYSNADMAGVVIKNDALTRFADDLSKKLADRGMDKGLHPAATAAWSRIEDAATNGRPITLKGMDILRQVVNDASRSRVPGESAIGGIMKNGIDDFLSNLNSSDVEMGDAGAGVKALQQARQLWSQASKAEQIQDLFDRAAVTAGGYSQSGYENALRSEFRRLAKNSNMMRRFSADEQEAIRNVAIGTPTANVVRFVGKFAPHGVISTVLTALGGHALGGELGMTGALAAGKAGSAIAGALTKSAARDVMDTILRGGPKSPGPYPSTIGLLTGGVPATASVANRAGLLSAP